MRALSHFYSAATVCLFRLPKVCQCPMRALSHFYSGDDTPRIEVYELCQCPMRALSHFYGTPLRMAYLRHFSGVVLQVFFRIFWKMLFWYTILALFIFCSYILKKYNFNKPALILNPWPKNRIVWASTPKHPDKSSSRLPTVETTHMRSAGIHPDR